MSRKPHRPTTSPGAGSAATPNAEASLQCALDLHRNGRLAQAEAIYADILEAHPAHFDALHLLGVIALQNRDYQRAADLIGAAIDIQPDIAVFHSNHGNALKELKQFDAALACFDKAIALEPDNAEAFYNRGALFQGLNRLDEAIASYGKAISFNPDYVDAFYNLGLALQVLRQFDLAIACYDRAIALRPDYAEAHNNRGNVLKDLQQFEHAIASYDQAISLRPDYAEAYCNRGLALQGLWQLDAAIASYDRAIALRPDHAEAYSNRGNALKEQRQLDAALASYDRAIEINPEYADAYWNKSLTLLLAGDYENGWKLYEWRWKRKSFTSPARNFPQPLWLGNEALNGKTILLHAEQGLGDTIQFCRYASLVAGLGARVVMEVPKPLLPLLKGLDGVAEFVETGAALPAFDFHCPLLSLPLAFRSRLDNLPTSRAYIRSDADKARHWETRLGTKTKPRVGLVWGGNAKYRNDHHRSIALSELLPYLPDTCDYVSLQKELRDVDVVTLQSRPDIRHFGEQLADFSDTAALCELMDVVVSVDTSVAHLAGALGKPTWITLPYAPDWRWLLERSDSVWYPAVRLYRKSSIGNWTSVFEALNSDLRKLSA